MIGKLIRLTVASALLTAGAARAAWFEASSPHFVVYADARAEWIKDYTARLERFDSAIRVLHGDQSDRPAVPASRVTVFILNSVDDVSKLHRNAAGFWQPATHPVAFMPRESGSVGEMGLTAQAIMFHEYTHHWMLTSWSDAALPAWYAEGAAEFHATAQLKSDGSVVFGALPIWRRYSIQTANVLPIERLLTAVPAKLDNEQTGALYGRGFLLTQYLTLDAGRRRQLADYIVAINSGKSPKEAAALLGNISDLTLDSWARRPSYPTIAIRGDQLKPGSVTVRQLRPGEAAVMPARIRSSAGVDKTTAPQVVALARTLAAPFPNDAAAQNELAEAEYDAASLGPTADAAAGYARAEAAADRAIAADPKSVHALDYKGMALQAAAQDAKKTDRATWQEVRRWYIAANRADTEDPEPLIRYYESFEAAKDAPTDGARSGILYAYALAPHDINARMLAGKVLMQQGKVREARAAIAPVAYRAEIGPAAQGVAKILTALDSGGASAGLAALKEAEDKSEAEREKARNGGGKKG